MKKALEKVPEGANIEIDFNNAKLVDHSTLENVNHFKREFETKGGWVWIKGLESHQPKSKHPEAMRVKNKKLPTV